MTRTAKWRLFCCRVAVARRAATGIRSSASIARGRTGGDRLRACRLPSQDQTARQRSRRAGVPPNVASPAAKQLMCHTLILTSHCLTPVGYQLHCWYAVVLIGRIMGFARPPVCLSVRTPDSRNAQKSRNLCEHEPVFSSKDQKSWFELSYRVGVAQLR